MMNEKILKINPYGYFIKKKMTEIGQRQKNCRKCWFFTAKQHCPEGYKCADDSNVYVFIRIKTK